MSTTTTRSSINMEINNAEMQKLASELAPGQLSKGKFSRAQIRRILEDNSAPTFFTKVVQHFSTVMQSNGKEKNMNTHGNVAAIATKTRSPRMRVKHITLLTLAVIAMMFPAVRAATDDMKTPDENEGPDDDALHPSRAERGRASNEEHVRPAAEGDAGAEDQAPPVEGQTEPTSAEREEAARVASTNAALKQALEALNVEKLKNVKTKRENAWKSKDREPQAGDLICPHCGALVIAQDFAAQTAVAHKHRHIDEKDRSNFFGHEELNQLVNNGNASDQLTRMEKAEHKQGNFPIAGMEMAGSNRSRGYNAWWNEEQYGKVTHNIIRCENCHHECYYDHTLGKLSLKLGDKYFGLSLVAASTFMGAGIASVVYNMRQGDGSIGARYAGYALFMLGLALVLILLFKGNDWNGGGATLLKCLGVASGLGAGATALLCFGEMSSGVGKDIQWLDFMSNAKEDVNGELVRSPHTSFYVFLFLSAITVFLLVLVNGSARGWNLKAGVSGFFNCVLVATTCAGFFSGLDITMRIADEQDKANLMHNFFILGGCIFYALIYTLYHGVWGGSFVGKDWIGKAMMTLGVGGTVASGCWMLGNVILEGAELDHSLACMILAVGLIFFGYNKLTGKQWSIFAFILATPGWIFGALKRKCGVGEDGRAL